MHALVRKINSEEFNQKERESETETEESSESREGKVPVRIGNVQMQIEEAQQVIDTFGVMDATTGGAASPNKLEELFKIQLRNKLVESDQDSKQRDDLESEKDQIQPLIVGERVEDRLSKETMIPGRTAPGIDHANKAKSPIKGVSFAETGGNTTFRGRNVAREVNNGLNGHRRRSRSRNQEAQKQGAANRGQQTVKPWQEATRTEKQKEGGEVKIQAERERK
nr:hypothetical protein Iba_chr03aCG4450 [Ipomoea batatas]